MIGLTEWRGEILTVLDLAPLLGIEATDEPRQLARLAYPLERTALAIPRAARLVTPQLNDNIRCIDPNHLVEPVERRMREVP